MSIPLNAHLSYDVDDASKEKGDLAAELIRDEIGTFVEAVRLRLEEAEIPVSDLRVNEDHEPSAWPSSGPNAAGEQSAPSRRRLARGSRRARRRRPRNRTRSKRLRRPTSGKASSHDRKLLREKVRLARVLPGVDHLLPLVEGGVLIVILDQFEVPTET